MFIWEVLGLANHFEIKNFFLMATSCENLRIIFAFWRVECNYVCNIANYCCCLGNRSCSECLGFNLVRKGLEFVLAKKQWNHGFPGAYCRSKSVNSGPRERWGGDYTIVNKSCIKFFCLF